MINKCYSTNVALSGRFDERGGFAVVVVVVEMVVVCRLLSENHDRHQ